MNDQEQIAYQQLLTKIQQHEQTIVQLLQIVASTNRMVNDLLNKQKKTNG